MLNNKIAIIGLGYVGLPLALAFGEKFNILVFYPFRSASCWNNTNKFFFICF
jgi:hypothetical protein